MRFNRLFVEKSGDRPSNQLNFRFRAPSCDRNHRQPKYSIHAGISSADTNMNSQKKKSAIRSPLTVSAAPGDSPAQRRQG